jgi:serine phosphatase RsbU (regulator of sigma subunit)/CHASE2 domain-containing sensor protein
LWVAAVAGFALAALLSLALSPRAPNAVFDAWQRLAPRDLSASDVRVIAIDDDSLELIGSWPWPRRTLAQMTQRIAQGGASAIGFDILFVEPDAVSPDRFSRLYPPQDPAIQAWIEGQDSLDAEFAQAISAAPVVLGRAGVTANGVDPAGLIQSVTIEGKPPAGLLRYPLVQGNLDILETGFPGFGLLNGAPDSDGRVRGVPLVLKTGETLAPGLALEMVRVAMEQESGTAPEIRLTPATVTIGKQAIPVDDKGRMRLHFANVPPAHIISAFDVMADDFDPSRLKGKIVVISEAAVGTTDIVATPMGSEMYGVLVQAQAMDAIRRGGWLVRPMWSQIAEWLAGAALAIALLLIAARQTRGRTTALVLLSALIALPLASWLLFTLGSTLFDPVRPLLLGGGSALAVSAALFSEARRERAALRDAQNRSEGELGAARAIQLGMLPDRAALAKLDPRIEIAAQLEAAKSVGGDFYDIIQLDADRVVILIADVTGKGVPAALFMALSKALSRSVMLRSTGCLADTAAMLNTELMRDSGDALGLTMLLCLIDLASGHVEMVNAGHDNPLRITTAGDIVEEPLEGGPPFCIMDYPWPAEHLTLLPGEALVLITDGVTEAQNREEQLFGNARTRAALTADQSSAGAMVETLCDAVRVFEDGTDASDDLTVVAFRFVGDKASPHE